MQLKGSIIFVIVVIGAVLMVECKSAEFAELGGPGKIGVEKKVDYLALACHAYAHSEFIDVSHAMNLFMADKSSGESCEVACSAMDKDFSFQYKDPNTCCCGDRKKEVVSAKGKQQLDYLRLACHAYAHSEFIDVSRAMNLFMTDKSSGESCEVACSAMDKDFSFQYKDPNTCCCGDLRALD